MNEDIKSILHSTCEHLLAELESSAQNIPFGSCYLLGHCLSGGLSKLGYNAVEISGNLILQDKNRKSIVYGKSTYKGKLVGKYHTWCVLDIGEKIIIDPSLKYNKIYLKKNLNIKLNERLPDFMITNEHSSWYYNYLEDSSLIPQSKSFLDRTDRKLIKHLINTVFESSKDLKNLLP